MSIYSDASLASTQSAPHLNVLFKAAGGLDNVCTNIFAVQSTTKPYTVYCGPAKNKKGWSFKPVLRSTLSVQNAIAEHGADAVLFGKGIGAKDGEFATVAFGEIDDCDYSGQAQRWAKFTGDTGLEMMLVHSGGKSIHGHVVFNEVVSLADQTLLTRFERALKMIAVQVGGDPAVVSGAPARSMRLPGINIDGHQQKVLQSPQASYAFAEVEARLEAGILAAGFDLSKLDHYTMLLRLAHRCTKHLEGINTGSYGDSVAKAILEENLAAISFPHYGEPTGALHAVLKALDETVKSIKDAAALAAAQAAGPMAVAAYEAKKAATHHAHSMLVKAGGKATTSADHDCYTVPRGHLFTRKNGATFSLRSMIHNHVAQYSDVVCPICGAEDAKAYCNGFTAKTICFHTSCNSAIYKEAELHQVIDDLDLVDGTYDNVTVLGHRVAKYTAVDAHFVPSEVLQLVAKILMLRAACGAGKTTAIKAHVAWLVEQHKAAGLPAPIVVVMGHRIALVEALKEIGAAVQMRSYKDPEFDGKPLTLDKCWAVCLDSIRRIPFAVNGEAAKIDLLVIDESDQFFRHLNATTLRKSIPAEVLRNHLAALFQISDKIILADATMSFLTPAMATALVGSLDQAHFVDVTGKHARKVTFHEGRDTLIAKIKADAAKADGRQLVLTNTRTEAEAIYDILVKMGRKCALITRDTSDGYRKNLQQAQEWVEGAALDVLVASPSVSSGVSFTGCFRHVYVIRDHNPTTGAADIIQALQRERAPLSGEIHVFIHPAERKDEVLELGHVTQNIIRRAKIECSEILAPTLSVSINPINGDLDVDLPTAHIVALAELSYKIEISKVLEDVLAYAAKASWAVTHLESAPQPEVKAEVKAAKDARRNERLTREMEADPFLTEPKPGCAALDMHEGKRLDDEHADKILGGEGHSEEDKARARKTKALMFINSESMNGELAPKLAALSLHGELHAKLTIRALVDDLLMGSTGFLACHNTKQRKNTQFTRFVKPVVSVAKLIVAAIQAHKVTLGEDGQITKLEAKATTAAQITSIVEQLRVLGHKVNGGKLGRTVANIMALALYEVDTIYGAKNISVGLAVRAASAKPMSDATTKLKAVAERDVTFLADLFAMHSAA